MKNLFVANAKAKAGFLLLLLPLTGISRLSVLFTDIAAESGIVESHAHVADCFAPLATGSAWADVDNDSDIDLYVTNHGGPNRLYLNSGPGLPSFVEVAEVYGVALAEVISNGVVFIDYDNDGDQDLYVLNLYGNNLFANQLMESGSLGFDDVTATAGIGDGGRAVTAAWGDFDKDGFLDLYLVKHKKCQLDPDNQDHLFHNNGDGTFEDVSHWLCGGSPTCAQLEGTGFSAAWVDYDNDGDADLYVANDAIEDYYHNVLWRNDGSDGNGNWTFTDVSEASGSGVRINSMGLGVGDYNNDGWFDFAVSSIGDKVLLKNMGDGTFQEVAREANVHMPRGITWGTVFFDFNNDGWEDLYFTNGVINPNPGVAPNMFYLNNWDGTFIDISTVSGLDDSGHGRGASIVDINGDGFVDVMLTNLYEEPKLFLNRSPELGNTNHWLTITVEGSFGGNLDGIGTRLTLVRPDSITMMREITSGPTHGGGDYRAAFFGLGGNEGGYLTVRWPSGFTEEIGYILANQKLHIVEPVPTPVDPQGPGAMETPYLADGYPNPFNPRTTIEFRISDFRFVTLKIYDLLGREVAVLVSEKLSPGIYSRRWDATTHPSGVYFSTLEAGEFAETRKLVLLR